MIASMFSETVVSNSSWASALAAAAAKDSTVLASLSS
jgi:hypothetical protein